MGEGEDVSDSIFNGITLYVRGDEWLLLSVTENKVPRWERAPLRPTSCCFLFFFLPDPGSYGAERERERF